MNLYKDCTTDCEKMPLCEVCHKTKKPIGRDAPVETYYCDEECPGYRQEPKPGHLWPGELADIRAVEK
jgi:hypothetical protein